VGIDANIGGETTPRLLEAREFGMTIHQQHGELMCSQRVQWGARQVWPPCEASTRKAFEAQPEALTIVNQQLDGGGAAITKEKHGS